MPFGRWVLVGRLLVGLSLAGLWGCGGYAARSSQGTSLDAQACESSGEFVHIPAGKFVMGSDQAERDYGYEISALAIAQTPEAIAKAEQGLRRKRWFEAEPKRLVVSGSAVCMARHLVTNADYQAFIQATGHRAPFISEADYQRQGFLVHPYRSVTAFLWQDDQFPDGKANHPVVLLSYSDAVAYATWRGQQDNAQYRLPTAQEWEQAARGSDGGYFPWGNEWQDEGTNWSGSGLDYTSAVGEFPLSRSPDGVEDMAGNVFEYTATEAFAGQRQVMKGCSWDDLPGFCRAAYRHTRPPESRHILFGFRLVVVGVQD